MSRKPYPTDLTDEQWERLEPLLPRPQSGTLDGGHPVTVDRGEVVNAIFYHLRGGAGWRMLPHDFPAWQTVYGLFRDLRLDGREAVCLFRQVSANAGPVNPLCVQCGCRAEVAEVPIPQEVPAKRPREHPVSQMGRN